LSKKTLGEDVVRGIVSEPWGTCEKDVRKEGGESDEEMETKVKRREYTRA